MLCTKCKSEEAVRKRPAVDSWCKSCLYAARQNSFRKGIVYVLECSHGEVKIGATTDLTKRISTIGTCNPEKLVLLRKVKTDKVFELEKLMHKKLASYRHKGEWYKPESLKVFDELMAEG
jgi:predicted GIY-YIG superfamily endonuclease